MTKFKIGEVIRYTNTYGKLRVDKITGVSTLYFLAKDGFVNEQRVKGRVEAKKDIVQVLNPKSGRYVKIDRNAGKILSIKRSEGKYKNIPVVKNRGTLKWK